MALVLMALVPLFSRLTVLMVIVGLIVIVFILFSQGFKAQSRKMEARFLENLNYKQLMEEKKAAIPSLITHQLRSKEIHIEEVEISPSSPKIGKTLRELNFRAKTRINIVAILRGNRKINIPDANERLYPYDRIVLAGADDDIQKLIQSIEERNKNNHMADSDTVEHHVSLSQYVVDHDSPMIGKTIAQLSVQEKTECIIICIDRNNESIINSPANLVLEEGDTLLLAGEREKLDAFKENLNS
jgi:CPA2 family monovalent cation:H+ antiporter-2